MMSASLCTQTGLHCLIAGSLESANSSILVVCNLFKEVVGKISGFYVNEIFKSQ